MTTRTTSPRAIIIHGYSATPSDHWFEWVASNFGSAGTPTVVPELPDSDAPDRERWADAVASAIGTPDRDTVIVAHSLGCLTVLRHLASLEAPWRVGRLVLVSGFLDRLPALPQLDDFIAGGCEVSTLAANIDDLTIVRSDLDPYVPTDHTDELAEKLGVVAQVLPGRGHFLAGDGVTTLPEILTSKQKDSAQQ